MERERGVCQACRATATVVHHRRYPSVLGEEPLEWLFALCAPCHDAIHRLAKKMSLRKATDKILGARPSPSRRHRPKSKPKPVKPPKSKKELRREARAKNYLAEYPRSRKLLSRLDKKTTRLTNDEMHRIQMRARAAREEHEHRRKGDTDG